MEKLNTFFVARDKDGTLNLWGYKPYRDKMTLNIKRPNKESITDEFWDHCDYTASGDKIHDEFIELDPNLFPDLKWEDEPIEVKLVEVENKTKQDKDDVEKVCKNCQFYREVPACYDSKGFCKDWKLSTYIINQMKKDKKE